MLSFLHFPCRHRKLVPIYAVWGTTKPPEAKCPDCHRIIPWTIPRGT